jgi:bifunctional non-homologous end joining protein LigD
VDNAPEGDAWLHEIKLDGYRTAARIEGGKVRLLTRTGLDWTARFRPIAAALASLPVKTAYLDGEVAVLGPDSSRAADPWASGQPDLPDLGPAGEQFPG